MITSDENWEDKWATPSSNIPVFTQANSVKKGEELYILVLYTNPKQSESYGINIGCDIRVVRPDGSISIDAADLDCATGRILGDLYALRMTNLSIKYIAETKDLPGTWTVNVNVKDRLRDATVELTSNFDVLD